MWTAVRVFLGCQALRGLWVKQEPLGRSACKDFLDYLEYLDLRALEGTRAALETLVC